MRDDWVGCTLGDLLALKNGFAFKSENYINEGIPVIRIGDINNWIVDETKAKCVTENEEYSGYIVKKGDILIAMSGATTGKFGVYNSDVKSYQNQRVGNLKPSSIGLIDKKYIFNLLYSLKYKIEEDAYGGAQPNISAGKIHALKTVLAPLPEQRAIVAKIEALFTDLDKGIADIKTAQAQLKIYRQAVLKKAFEGELTKQWRAQQTELPTAEELLAQIKDERQKYNEQQLVAWDSSLKAWENSGKQAKKPRKPLKLKSFQISNEEDYQDLPRLPSSWMWTIYENICVKVRNGISKKPNEDPSGEKIFRISAVRPAKFDLSDFRKISNKGEFDDYLLQKGDLVFTRYNGTRNFVGVCAMFNSQERFLYPDKLIQTRILSVIFNPSFIEYASNCSATRKFVEFRIRTTAGQSGISGGDIKSMPIPVCSIREQHQIVREIESRLSVCDKVEQAIAESLERAEALRQSILKKAFEGRLLSEAEIAACKAEKDYQPASALLAKINAEKNKSGKNKQ